MGVQIGALEHRLQARETEFAMVIENIQSSHVLERARLIAVHQKVTLYYVSSL